MSQVSPIADLPTVRQYLRRIKAEMRSLFKAAIIRKVSGYDREIATIRFNRSGEVETPEHIAPTEAEREAIASEITGCTFPDLVLLTELPLTSMPETLQETHSHDLYIFRNRSGSIVMLQQRVQLKNGDKRYVPWTYWSDGQWRKAEPDHGLPIWGIDEVDEGGRVFIHEGAKAARAAQQLIKDYTHPWSRFLSTGSHVGWIGGVHQVRKNLWQELVDCRPSEVVIVPDNDDVGRRVVPSISRRFRCRVSQILFDDQWPRHFDMADPIPEEMFDEGIYHGPSAESILFPADWAIDEIPNGNRAPTRIVRDAFAERWVRVQRTKTYCPKDNPHAMMDKDQFNTLVLPFSRVPDTAAVLGKTAHTIVDEPTFRPDLPYLIITDGGRRYINQYRDMRLAAKPGDTKVFSEFMEFMVPEQTDRYNLTKWCATLFAKPETRIIYGVLILSRLQGVGKTTLGNILSAMIGKHQVSYPSDSMITNSDFNGWLVNKRLIIVNEIYAGQNWRAYNKLKSLVTDPEIEANVKFMPTYTAPNFAHFYICSNSMEALKLEDTDRRWFVPRVAETLWGDDNYNRLYAWIRSGGLAALAHEWLQWGDYVESGHRAPDSDAKRDLIDASRSPDEVMLGLLLDELKENQVIETNAAWLWLREQMRGHTYLSPRRLIHLAKAMGFGVTDRIKVNGKMMRVIAQDERAAARFEEAPRGEVSSALVDPSALRDRNRPM